MLIGICLGGGIVLLFLTNHGVLDYALTQIKKLKGMRYQKVGRKLNVILPNGDTVDYLDYLYYREFYNQFHHTAKNDKKKWKAWTDPNSREKFYTLFRPENLCPTKEMDEYLSHFYNQEHNKLETYPDGFLRSLTHDIVGNVRELLWYPLHHDSLGFKNQWVKGWQKDMVKKYLILVEAYRINGIDVTIPDIPELKTQRE